MVFVLFTARRYGERLISHSGSANCLLVFFKRKIGDKKNRLRVKFRCMISTTVLDPQPIILKKSDGLKPFWLIFGLAEFTGKVGKIQLIYG